MEDNYICKRCNNDKCNTSEKSCWKCGEEIKLSSEELLLKAAKCSEVTKSASIDILNRLANLPTTNAPDWSGFPKIID